MLKPLQVDVAADVVAQNQVGFRDGRKGCLAPAEIHADVGLYVGAVVDGVAHLFRLQDEREGLFLDGQLQRVHFGVDRDHVKGLDQFDGVAADHHIGGLAALAFRAGRQPVVVVADHLLLEQMHLALVVALFCFLGRDHGSLLRARSFGRFWHNQLIVRHGSLLLEPPAPGTLHSG